MSYYGEIYKKRYKNFIMVVTIPVVIFYTIFMIFPIIQSLYYSLFNWSGFNSQMEYIKANNYIELFTDNMFLASVWNSLKYVFYGGVIIIGITILFTYVITNYKSKRLKSVIQMILFIPNTISPVALGLLWSFVLNTRWGLVNSLLRGLHLDFLAKGWLGDDYIFGAALSLLVWIHVGYFIVLYVAAADRIPSSLYEAIEIDGASSWRKFISITLPLIKDVIESSIVLWIVFSFKIFGYLYVFSAGGAGSDPQLAIRNLSVQLYLVAFGKRTPINRLGYACAMAIMLLIMVALLVSLVRKLMSTDVIEY